MSTSPRLRMLWFVSCSFFLVALSHPAIAERSSVAQERARRAQQLAKTGTHFDLEGAAKYARFTWQAALRVDPDCRLARSRLGYIQQGDRWILAEDGMSASSTAASLSDYRRVREGHLDRGDRELSLAIWCQNHSLSDLAAVHLRRVVANPQIDSTTQMAAARRLGLRWFGGRLMTNDEITDLQTTLQRAQRDLQEWSQRITKWVRQLQGNRPTHRQEAIDALRGIDDPTAIPAVELLMSAQDERLASEAIGIISEIQHADAAESLARHAIAAPWPNVRREAMIQLNKRPYHDFVPLLLRGLQTPIRSVFQVTPGPAGRILHEHLLFQEGADENLQLELSTLAVAAFDRGRDRQQSTQLQQQRVIDRAQRVERGVATWNQVAGQQNQRIYQVLQQTTGQSLEESPLDWWDWWKEYNEYEQPITKPTRRQRNYLAYQYFPMPAASECFPAGTLVWTESGQTAIERIQVGDRVLSQDTETGQLSYKPVADVTRRSNAAMQQIQVGETWLTMTTGHPVWVNGRGWRMAKFLRLGDQIHTLNGSQPVNHLAVASAGKAYNLVVADYGTYFVTEEGILVHDNNERTSTRVQTPGLLAQN